MFLGKSMHEGVMVKVMNRYVVRSVAQSLSLQFFFTNLGFSRSMMGH